MLSLRTRDGHWNPIGIAVALVFLYVLVYCGAATALFVAGPSPTCDDIYMCPTGFTLEDNNKSCTCTMHVVPMRKQ